MNIPSNMPDPNPSQPDTGQPTQPSAVTVQDADRNTEPKRGRAWWLNFATKAGAIVGSMVLAIILLGVAQRVGWLSESTGVDTADGAAASSGDTIYTCAMHPQIRQPRPGNCPICGMKLVPATTVDPASADPLAVKIDPVARRLAGIDTAEVRKIPVSETIRSVGEIAMDESRMATIASYIDGRIERLFADYTGVRVAEGDHLAVVYSPELYTAQVEYLQSRKTLDQMQPNVLASVRTAQQQLVAGSRQRLLELGLTEKQLEELDASGEAKSRLTIHTPIGGTVVEKMAVEGMYISAGEPIYRVADLSTVWLVLELFPEDAARIRFGQDVEAEMQTMPGQKFHGRVAFVDPVVDTKTRTVGVRVEFLNPDRQLRPGDYANAVIRVPLGLQGQVYDAQLAGKWISPMHPQVIREEPGECPICGMQLVPTSEYGYSDVPVGQPEALVVPRSAVLMAGSNSVVYVETEPGRFEIRPVVLGPVLRDEIVIREGIEAGERVATAGNFLIDSQMQLAGKPSVIDPSRAQSRPAGESPGGPLQLDSQEAFTLPGSAAEVLDELFASYFKIQQSLANDQRPVADDVATLREAADSLSTSEDLPPIADPLLREILQTTEHLHHLELPEARQRFKPLSHAVLRLAATLRGTAQDTSLVHFYCPMVPGGGGDWLQASGPLANPYFGSEMLRCGEEVGDLAKAKSAEQTEDTQ